MTDRNDTAGVRGRTVITTAHAETSFAPHVTDIGELPVITSVLIA